MSCVVCRYSPKTTKCIYCGDNEELSANPLAYPVVYPDKHVDNIFSEIAEIKKDIRVIKSLLEKNERERQTLTCVCGNKAKENCLACDKPVCRPCIDGYNTTGVVCKECARCPTGY